MDRWFINTNDCIKVGDAYGNKPKTRWLAHSRKFTVSGGPTMWIHNNHACETQSRDPDNACFKDLAPGMTCQPDDNEFGIPREDWEEDGNVNQGCERFRLISGIDEIALNSEIGLYKDFEGAK